MALVLSGSIDISGSMTATTIVVSAPGVAGMVSSSAQITELAPLMAYTASLKGAAIVSSSQQVQNYFTFARTGSVNTFFGNQGISGSLNVTNATGTNVTPQLTVTNTTTNGYGILRLVGAARGGIIDFYNTSSAQASITANDGALQIYTNGDSSGTVKATFNNSGYFQLGAASENGRIEISSRQDFYPDFLILKATQLYSSVDYSFQVVTSTQDFRIFQGSERFRISYNGSIGAGGSTTNIYNASDIRLKKNITPISYGLDTISMLNPVKFNWADGFEPVEADKTLLGFIAQEVEEVIPEAIESFGGSIDLNGTTIENTLRVNEKFLIPVLTKAIQEQQAIIDGLIARIEALENN